MHWYQFSTNSSTFLPCLLVPRRYSCHSSKFCAASSLNGVSWRSGLATNLFTEIFLLGQTALECNRISWQLGTAIRFVDFNKVSQCVASEAEALERSNVDKKTSEILQVVPDFWLRFQGLLASLSQDTRALLNKTVLCLRQNLMSIYYMTWNQKAKP